jgi:hypothetical protein
METQNEKIDRKHVTERVDKTQEQQLWWGTKRKSCQKLNRPGGNIK